ncbi:hypothetical protein KSC_054380 [Ktedonobacter sp. SOSP1-52]|uniref:hypothetical protein n=1 Tax=Ktedonobacter sp. SOSP1-52 TaxID=2778366 RepID=UPI001915946D|nr:hypothetical protein [Ktedonobacter sp. SOSP1-52]GHO66546.1 hypothetical protein KSC_054380 [Ktedonobacter sp. SOSP1-52]
MSKDSKDPLAAFRKFGQSPFKQISTTATPDQMAGDPHHYSAYGLGERSQERLEIRSLLAPWHAPSYHYLLDIVFNGNFGTETILTFSFLVVKIEGKNLQAVNVAIREGVCTYIQDYDKREFTPPAEGEPVITKIEAVMRKEERI